MTKTITICCVVLVFPVCLNPFICWHTTSTVFKTISSNTKAFSLFSAPPIYRFYRFIRLWSSYCPMRRLDWSIQNLVAFIWWLIKQKRREHEELLKNLFIVYSEEKRWCPYYIISRRVHRVGQFWYLDECSTSNSICVWSTLWKAISWNPNFLKWVCKRRRSKRKIKLNVFISVESAAFGANAGRSRTRAIGKVYSFIQKVGCRECRITQNVNFSRVILSYLVAAYSKDDTLYPRDIRVRALVDQRLQFDMGTLYARLLQYFVMKMNIWNWMILVGDTIVYSVFWTYSLFPDADIAHRSSIGRRQKGSFGWSTWLFWGNAQGANVGSGQPFYHCRFIAYDFCVTNWGIRFRFDTVLPHFNMATAMQRLFSTARIWSEYTKWMGKVKDNGLLDFGNTWR